MLRLATLLVLAGSFAASAAAIKTPAVGCRAEADAKTLDALRAQGNADGFDKLTTARTGTGDCVTFARGTLVTVEDTHAPFVCARLEGGLDCFWLPDRAVSLANPEPEQHNTTGNRSLKF